MENWRGYVNEENEKIILTEEELNELLQEIGALKSMLGRARGGKKFGQHGYGWEAAIEQWGEDDVQQAAQSLGMPDVKTKEDFVTQVKTTIDKAEKSGDERAKEAVKDLTTDIEQSAEPEVPGTPVAEPEVPEAPVEEPAVPETPGVEPVPATPGEAPPGETTIWGAINQELVKNDIQLADAEIDAIRNMLKGQSEVAGIPLNEATAWEEVKYLFGKLGRLEKGGKIIGRGKAEKENKAKIEKMLEDPAAKVVAEFKKKLEEEYPGFPNTKETVNYAMGLAEIWLVYDSIANAAKKKPTEKGYMAPAAANVLIRALYELVNRYANYELSDPGEHFDEGKKLDEKIGDRLRAALGGGEAGPVSWEDVVHELVQDEGPDILRSAKMFAQSERPDALINWAGNRGLSADQLGAIARAAGESPEEALRLAQGLANHGGYTGEALSSAAEAMINPAAEAAVETGLDAAAEAAIDQAAEVATSAARGALAPADQALTDALKQYAIRGHGSPDSGTWWPDQLIDRGMPAEEVQALMQDLDLEIPDRVADAVAGAGDAATGGGWQDVIANIDFGEGPGGGGPGIDADAAREMQDFFSHGGAAEDLATEFPEWNLGEREVEALTQWNEANTASPEAIRNVRQALEPDMYGSHGSPYQPQPDDPEWLIPDATEPPPSTAGADLQTALQDAGVPDSQAAEIVTGNADVTDIQQAVEKLPPDALEPFQHAIKGVGATDLGALQIAGFWLTNLVIPVYVYSKMAIGLLRLKGRISSRKKEINKLLQGIDEVPETSGFAGEETNIREMLGKIATIVDGETASAIYTQLASELKRLGYEKMLQREGLRLLKEETIDLSNIKIPPEKYREVGLLLLKGLRPIGADINLGGELLNAAELGAAAPPEEPTPEEPTADAAAAAAAGVDLSAVYTIITDAARADKIAQIIYRVLTSMGVEVIKPSPGEAGDWEPAKMAAENFKKENKLILERWHQLAGIKPTFLRN